MSDTEKIRLLQEKLRGLSCFLTDGEVAQTAGKAFLQNEQDRWVMSIENLQYQIRSIEPIVHFIAQLDSRKELSAARLVGLYCIETIGRMPQHFAQHVTCEQMIDLALDPKQFKEDLDKIMG